MIQTTIDLSLIFASLLKYWGEIVISHDSSTHHINNNFQSAYHPGNSTEIVLEVNDLFLSLSKDNMSMLALFDFLQIYHSILVHHLHADFGFTDAVNKWCEYYLTVNTQYVSLSDNCSAFATMHSGVNQGLVLGSMLFTMHIKPLSTIIYSHYHTSFIY